MLKQFVLSALVVVPFVAQANEVMDQVRVVIPQGTDVAQVQAAVLRGSARAEADLAGEGNVVARDFNGDGLQDILVIVEENPKLQNWETDKACASTNEDNCRIVYGKRTLQVYLGQKDKSLKLFLSNDQVVLGGDDGGVWGDPLEALTVSKKDSVSINVYGGSADRWGYSDIIQFRQNDFYLVGQSEMNMSSLSLKSFNKDTNLITGKVIETRSAGGDAPLKTKTYKIKVKPLVKVRDMKARL